MFSILLFFSVFSVINAQWENSGNIYAPMCKRLRYNKNDYEGFSLPIDFYAVTEEMPINYDIRNFRILPEMKQFYSVLPNARTDIITFYGSTTKPNVQFSMIFGETDDQLSYVLLVYDGNLYLQQTYNSLRHTMTAVKLPENFAIEVEFAVDGASVTLYDTADDGNHVVVKGPICTLYRAIPTGISYMAVFMDCESVEFESITMLTFLQKPALYHMHVPQGEGNDYGVSNAAFATIYTGASIHPVYDATGTAGGTLDKKTVFTGFVNCNLDQCKMSIYGTWLAFVGMVTECPLLEVTDGIWFLCTNVVNKWCLFESNVLE
uniref:IgGFc_binding domain-containing protein n=1 Tax=Panagrellus redivivus TaxID=6233 RepID=A0A7E4VIP7_PANRE